MAFVPGFRHDVFVSYAHVDDMPIPGVDKGWVTTFIAYLKIRLSQSLGRTDAYSLWMDYRFESERHAEIAPAILDNIRQSAVLVLILSPGYLASEWCKRERNAFLHSIRSGANSQQSIFLVVKEKADREQWPSEFQNLVGYQFWKQEIDGRVMTLGSPAPTPDEPAYYHGLHNLAWGIVQTLKELKETATTASPSLDVAAPEISVATPMILDLPQDVKDQLNTKLEQGQYDVFLCHNSEDKTEVKKIGKLLMSRGLLPWLDEWDLQPGLPWQIVLEQQIEHHR